MGKLVFCAFMDSQKVYNMIDFHVMWQMLRVYGVGEKLFEEVLSFYVDSRESVLVRRM